MDPFQNTSLFPNDEPTASFNNASRNLFRNRIKQLDEFDAAKVEQIESRQQALQEYLHNSKDAYLGLEYVYEVINVSGRGYYYCCLCKAKCYMSPGVSMSIVTHLIAFNHRMKYLQYHFKQVHRNINSCPKEKRKAIAARICVDMEKVFGRLQITQIFHKDFSSNRNNKILYLRNGPHFPDYPIHKFLQLVLKYNHCPDLEAETRLVQPAQEQNQPPLKKYRPGEDQQNTRAPATLSTCQPCIYDTSDQNNVVEKTENSIKNDSTFERESNIWTCKRITDEVEDQIERDFKRHMENPEEHPEYSKEWTKYWKEKYAEFKQKGINMYKYDLEPEWKEFWKQRMIQLYLKSKENLEKMRSKTQQASQASTSSEKRQDNAVIFLNVLKLLTALEEYLGTYSTQIKNLYSKATAMEIEKGQDLEALINGDNYILLKDVNEHLKGQLQAGLVNGTLENVFRTALRSIDKLIEIFIRKNKRQIDEIVKGLMTAPGISEVERVKVLQAIVDKLSAQGKTHTTEEELKELIKDLIKELVQPPSTSCAPNSANTPDSIPSTSGFSLSNGGNFGTPTQFNTPEFNSAPPGTNYNSIGHPPAFNHNLPPPLMGSSHQNPMGGGPFANQPMVGGNNFVWGGAQNQFGPQRMNVPPPSTFQQMIAYPKVVPSGARFSDFRRGSGGVEFDSTSNSMSNVRPGQQTGQYDQRFSEFPNRFDNSRRY